MCFMRKRCTRRPAWALPGAGPVEVVVVPTGHRVGIGIPPPSYGRHPS